MRPRRRSLAGAWRVQERDHGCQAPVERLRGIESRPRRMHAALPRQSIDLDPEVSVPVGGHQSPRASAVACRLPFKPLPIRADIVVMVVRVALTLVAAVLLAPSAFAAAGNADVAALQVGLRARGVYTGPIDGLSGPQTTNAVRLLGSATPTLTAGLGLQAPVTCGRFSVPTPASASATALYAPAFAAGTSPPSSSCSPGRASRQAP